MGSKRVYAYRLFDGIESRIELDNNIACTFVTDIDAE